MILAELDCILACRRISDRAYSDFSFRSALFSLLLTYLLHIIAVSKSQALGNVVSRFNDNFHVIKLCNTGRPLQLNIIGAIDRRQGTIEEI
ncbi:hypothetical protein MKW92_033130, partial [Papaver armeniacum]